MREHSILATVALASCFAVTCSAVTGCRKQADPAPEASAPSDSAVTEAGENGTVAWDVSADGKIRGMVKGTDGKPITKEVTGTMVWPGEVADEERDIALDENGNLVAAGPPLEDDLTEIDYSLTIDGKPWTGVLHVPKGGTRAIEEDAKASVELAKGAPQKGPNGGVVQYIGKQPVELVADSNSREVRLYVLDSSYQVMDPGDRTFRLGYAADYSGMQVLVREPSANYYVGPWYAGYNPYRITVAMNYGAEVHVGIVGWTWGASWRWGVAAPLFFVGVRGWAPSYSLRVGWGYGWGWGWGRGGYVRGGERWGMRGGVGWGHSDRGWHGGNPRGGGHGDHGGGHGDHGGGHGDHGGGHGDHGGGDHGGGDHGGHAASHGGDHGGGDHGGHASPGGHGSPGGGGHASPGGGGHAAPSRGGGAAPRSGGGGKRR